MIYPQTLVSGGSKGARRMRAPPLARNLFIFMQFSGKIGQIIGWHPPSGLGAPPLGNPGSATASPCGASSVEEGLSSSPWCEYLFTIFLIVSPSSTHTSPEIHAKMLVLLQDISPTMSYVFIFEMLKWKHNNNMLSNTFIKF